MGMNTDKKKKIIDAVVLAKGKIIAAAILAKGKIIDVAVLAKGKIIDAAILPKKKANATDASTRRRIIAVAALLTAVLFTGTSYWAGKSTEQAFRDGIEEMARYGIKVTLADYQRGVFSAKARTELALTHFGENPVMLSFNHSIRHGPMLPFASASSIRSELKPAEEFSTLLVDAFGSDPFGGKPPLTVKTTVGWGGESSSRIVSPKFKAATKNNQVWLSWDGLDGEFMISSGHSRIKTNAVMGGLSIGSGKDRFETGRATLQGDMAKAKGYDTLFVGTSSLALDKFSFHDTDEDTGATRAFAVEDVRGETGMALADGTLDIKIRFDSGKAVMDDKLETAIDKLGATFLYENIDAQALEAILQAVLGHEDPFLVLEKQAEALMQREPAFSVTDISIGWPEGMIVGNFRIAYTGDGDLDQFSLGDLAVDLQFDLPTEPINRLLKEQASRGYTEETREQVAMINAMINRGVLVEKDGVLSIDASLKGGALSLSGKPESLETLQELLEFF
jgi:uncharacterized protein YdgA (DUF945 family)